MKKSFFLMVTVMTLLVLFVSMKTSWAAEEKPIELKYSSFLPPMHYMITDVFLPFTKELEERSKGRVKVVCYYGETLGKAKDQYDMVTRGIADMATVVMRYTPGRFPLSGVTELPIPIPSARVGAQVVWDLYGKVLKQEYAEAKVIMLSSHEPAQLHMPKKSVKNLSDLKGLRMKVGGGGDLKIVKAWDASPLMLSMPETYDALQKGMADGIFTGWSAMLDFRLNELCKYHTIVDTFTTCSGLFMNLKTWNSLPPDIQKMIDEIGGLRLALQQGEGFDKRSQSAIDAAKKAGDEIYTLPSAEKKIWMQKAAAVSEEWIADMEKKGLPGKKVYEEAIGLLQKYSN